MGPNGLDEVGKGLEVLGESVERTLVEAVDAGPCPQGFGRGLSISPRPEPAIPAAGGAVPLLVGGQSFAGPLGVFACVQPAHPGRG